MKLIAKTVVALSVLRLCSPALGQLSQDAASNITRQVDAVMADYTDTLVTPTIHTDGVIVVSMKSLQSEKVTKLWTFIAAAALGKYFNDHPNLGMKEIWFSDITNLKSKPIQYFVLPMDVAMRVQVQVHDGKMDLNEGQAKVWSSLVRKTRSAQ